MDWQELRGTTMDSATRTLLQVNVEEAAEAENIMSVLMGDDVESRKAFIQKNSTRCAQPRLLKIQRLGNHDYGGKKTS